MTQRYDVIVIGGGNAGFAVAKQTHEAGMRTAMIESAEFGGTCPNRGCTPKKVLVAAARALDEINKAAHHGIDVSPPKLDWAYLIDREQNMIAHIPGAMERVAANRAETFRGSAKFVGKNQVAVNGNRLIADNIVIATGSTPRSLDIPGGQFLSTSDDLLRNRRLPEDVVFIGGGIIALEFSHVLARAGAKVTVLEALPRLLPRMDSEAVNVLQSASEDIGIRFLTDVKVEGVARTESGFFVDYHLDGEAFRIEAESAVNGTGRVPNVAGLNLTAADVHVADGTIETDQYYRSRSNPNVWIVGDAFAGSAQLSPLATWEGERVGRYLVEGLPEASPQPHIPQVIHSVPALSCIGLTEDAARALYDDVEIHRHDMSGWFSAQSHAESTAWAKVLIDRSSDLFLGAHLVGHGSEELIHLFTLAMNRAIPASALKEMVFAFPTFSADLKNLF